MPHSGMNNSSNQTFSQFWHSSQERTQSVLEAVLPPPYQPPTNLHQAMHYSCLGPGAKRVRPTLVYATAVALNIPQERVDNIACAIELIHTYSLIHDDLPSMDNDDERRGRPTCHIAFDEATAILAGNALQALAFGVLANRQRNTHLSEQQALQMVYELAKVSGYDGLIGGQALDMSQPDKPLTLDQIHKHHHAKTGALLEACVNLTLITAPSISAQDKHVLQEFARAFGLLFQIQDDVLDFEPNNAEAHKSYPGIVGLQAAQEKVVALGRDAIHCLANFGKEADHLRGLTEFCVHRHY